MKSLRMSVLAVSLAAAFAVPGMAQIETSPAVTRKTHAFVWDSVNGMQDIGTLGGKVSYALAVNESGTVIGYSYLRDNVTSHVFLWTAAGGMVDLGKHFPATISSQGSFINSSGNVAGEGIPDGGIQAASALIGHRWVSLPQQPGDDSRNYSFGINDANQLTGQRYQGSTVHAFVWDPAAQSIVYIPALPGGIHTVGNAINNLGHVTGTGNTGIAYTGLFWTPEAGSQDIGSLAGSQYTAGQGLNDHDEIVGINSPELGGFYWSGATGMVALQSLGGSMSPAFGINNGGMISGYSTTSTGATHAALWSSYLAAPMDLGTLPGGTNSYARGLNNNGMVVGYADAQ